MRLLFTPEALEAYESIKKTHPRECEQVKDILKDVLLHPDSGKGSPTALTGNLCGLWSREYGVHRQIIYQFSNESVKIFAVGKSLINAINTPEEQVVQTQYSEEDYRNVLAQMEANRGKGETPKVGIFWYNIGRDELFGVISHPVDDYSRTNASNGRITCSELHEDVWKKEFYKQRYKSDGKGPFIGQYQDKPRGRVFYDVTTDCYEVATGKWIQEYPHVYDMILQEFNLPPEKTSLKYAVHWDIGHSWR